MSGSLYTRVGDIHQSAILTLIEELESACPVGSRHFLGLPLITFLTQCLYPQGDGKRIPITTALAASAPLLESRVGKFPDGPLRDLCGELAPLSNTALEFYSGNKVYVLLNKAVPKLPKPKKSGAKQQRWESVYQQRRSNR